MKKAKETGSRTKKGLRDIGNGSRISKIYSLPIQEVEERGHVEEEM